MASARVDESTDPHGSECLYDGHEKRTNSLDWNPELARRPFPSSVCPLGSRATAISRVTRCKPFSIFTSLPRCIPCRCFSCLFPPIQNHYTRHNCQLTKRIIMPRLWCTQPHFSICKMFVTPLRASTHFGTILNKTVMAHAIWCRFTIFLNQADRVGVRRTKNPVKEKGLQSFCATLHSYSPPNLAWFK